MIKAVIFDLDGMVFKEPHYFTKELEVQFGIPKADSLFSEEYDSCKRGEVSLNIFLKPYYDKWKTYPKFALSFEETKDLWFNFAIIQNEVIDIAKKLNAKGVLNLILTNNTRERIEFLKQKYNLAETFEIIGSFDLGALKPDSKFNKVLKDKYHLGNSEILYCDDKQETVEELEKQGFSSFCYTDIESFKEKLEGLEL